MHKLLREYPVVIQIAVAWGEMDAFQHVNNTVYFRYFESARIAYLQRLGFTQQTGIGPILGAASCRFRRPLTYPDTVSVGVRVVQMQDDRLEMDMRLVSHKLGVVAAEGAATLVAYDYQRQCKAKLPGELQAHIQDLEKEAAL